MEEAIANLAYIRQVVSEREIALAAYEIELHATQLWKCLEERRASLQKAKMAQSDLEAEVRKRALTAYAETGDKAPHPAVKIKMYAVLEYKEEDAINYAREHLPRALKLDKRIFKKAAQAVAMNFVAILQEARATITRDLSKYLPGDEEAE